MKNVLEYHLTRLIPLYNVCLMTPQVEFLLLEAQSTNKEANGRNRPRADDFIPFGDDFIRLARKSHTGPHPYTYTDLEPKYHYFIIF